MKFLTRILLSCVLLLAASSLWSQQPLPKGLTEEEKALLPHYDFHSAQRTPPPTGEIRTMAEWEEVEYLVISWDTYFQNILRQIVQAAVQECKVIITTQDQSSVESYLNSFDIDMNQIIFLNAPSNSLWIRDYAANTVYREDVGERILVDWIYNRPRPADDMMPNAHANLLNIPLYVTNTDTNDLVNTGGNFMSDGLGNAFASNLILEENQTGNPYGVTPKTEAQINTIMQQYMGIENYVKMTVMPYDYIHHIDMHMKLLDEETLLIAEYPQGVADGPQIEDNIQYIQDNFVSPFGTPYKIERIPSPSNTNGTWPNNGGDYNTYTNAVFINKTVLIPNYRSQVDEPAMAKWQELLPGYNIVGIDVDNSGENLISLSGAIHCITHTIGVENPLWIVHNPIEQAQADTQVTIEAQIKHITGIQEAYVYYKLSDAQNFTQLPLSNAGNDRWTTTLSIPNTQNDIEYYISAEANSGKQLNRPIVAPTGYWTIDVSTLGTQDAAKANNVTIYPNPAKEWLMISAKAQIRQVSLYNTAGQMVFQRMYSPQNQEQRITLNPDWQGEYMMLVETNLGKSTHKVLIK